MGKPAEPKRGRPFINGTQPAKNRNVRLTDEEWQTFREQLGVKWLRKQIAEASTKLTSN